MPASPAGRNRVLDRRLEGIGHGFVVEALSALAGLVAQAGDQRRFREKPADRTANEDASALGDDEAVSATIASDDR